MFSSKKSASSSVAPPPFASRSLAARCSSDVISLIFASLSTCDFLSAVRVSQQWHSASHLPSAWGDISVKRVITELLHTSSFGPSFSSTSLDWLSSCAPRVLDGVHGSRVDKLKPTADDILRGWIDSTKGWRYATTLIIGLWSSERLSVQLAQAKPTDLRFARAKIAQHSEVSQKLILKGLCRKVQCLLTCEASTLNVDALVLDELTAALAPTLTVLLSHSAFSTTPFLSQLVNLRVLTLATITQSEVLLPLERLEFLQLETITHETARVIRILAVRHALRSFSGGKCTTTHLNIIMRRKPLEQHPGLNEDDLMTLPEGPLPLTHFRLENYLDRSVNHDPHILIHILLAQEFAALTSLNVRYGNRILAMQTHDLTSAEMTALKLRCERMNDLVVAALPTVRSKDKDELQPYQMFTSCTTLHRFEIRWNRDWTQIALERCLMGMTQLEELYLNILVYRYEEVNDREHRFDFEALKHCRSLRLFHYEKPLTQQQWSARTFDILSELPAFERLEVRVDSTICLEFTNGMVQAITKSITWHTIQLRVSDSVIAVWGECSKFNDGSDDSREVHLHDKIEYSLLRENERRLRNFYVYYNQHTHRLITPMEEAGQQQYVNIAPPVTSAESTSTISSVAASSHSPSPSYAWLMRTNGVFRLRTRAVPIANKKKQDKANSNSCTIC